jgi:type I restriction enzyme S subunit
LTSLNKAAAVPGLNREDAYRLPVFLPPLEEQRRIAEVLDRAEALRAKRRAALALLETLTQAVFFDLFGDPSRGTSIPTIPLGSILRFVTSGGRGWARFYSSAGRRFIRSLDVQMNAITSDNAVYVQPPENAETRRTRVLEGDVLLTITGSLIGRVAAAGPECDGAHVSQHVAILRIDESRMSPSFLSFFLSLKQGGQAQIQRMQYGQTKPGLNFEQIQRFQILIPPIVLQQEFALRLAAVEKLRAAHRASLAQLDALFASIQHRAFSGEL